MPNYKLALVDIETTGGRSTYDCITEVAVILIDQDGEVERWETLVKPTHYIPEFIQQMTGITNEMVADAPSFHEIAEQLLEKLKGCIFVAHNARFDYGFIKNHFARMGINFQAKVLCSVRLSRKLFPEYKSHSMDRLIENHHLMPLSRHRAMGDADLIKQFLKVCKKTFGLEKVIEQAQQLLKQSALPPRLETDIKKIPNTPGVYLFYSNHNTLPIYIGKSVNLRARVMSHFTADYTTTKESNISMQTTHIDFIETAGELEALLLESKLIKENLPVYNRRLRRNKLSCGYVIQDIDGYHAIKIISLGETSNQELEQTEIYGCFRSKRQAEQKLEDLIKQHHLCPKLCGLEKPKHACFAYQLKRCKGACVRQETAELYNLRIDMALLKYKQTAWPYIGPIGIKEHCDKNGKQAIHVFNNWRHLGSIKDYSDLDHIDLNSHSKLNSTWDDIKIIQSFLLIKVKKQQIIQIIDDGL